MKDKGWSQGVLGWAVLVVLLFLAAPARAGTDGDWTLTGNSGTTPGTNFVGTADNKALEVKVNNVRALRIEPMTSSPNIVGGWKNNAVSGGAYGATIVGGGYGNWTHIVTGIYGVIGGGAGNSVYSLEATVAGGYRNIASGSRSTVVGGLSNFSLYPYATIGGGAYNLSRGDYATISGGGPGNPASPESTRNFVTDNYGTTGGGCDNQAGNDDPSLTNAAWATVAGGTYGEASGLRATVGGGYANVASGTASFVGSGWANEAGGNYAAVASGRTNEASGDFAVVGGGRRNVASGEYSTISGGGPVEPIVDPNQPNNIATDDYCMIGGGSLNQAGDNDADTTNATFATVAGGYWNRAYANFPAIAGGNQNKATDGGCTVLGGAYNQTGDSDGNSDELLYATIGGGYSNEATQYADTILGGYNGSATGLFGFVGGGYNNEASGESSMAIGGDWCTASGSHSLAAGRIAKATAQGVFAWADASTTDPFTVATANRFAARAQGGFYFYSKSDLSTGAYVASSTGTWSSVSDRDAKTDVQPVDTKEVLEKASEIPISTWWYKGEDPAIRHMGPMAQDVYAAFGLGDSDKAIANVDADGITLASIQALHQGVKDRSVRMNELEREIQRLMAVAQKLATK